MIYKIAFSLLGEEFVVLVQLGAHHHVPGMTCHVGEEVAVKELDNLQEARVWRLDVDGLQWSSLQWSSLQVVIPHN